MSITVDWYEEEKLNICYKLVGRWTWQDLFDAIEDAVVLLDSVNYPVNIILDVTGTSHVPTLAVNHMARLANAPTVSHPNTNQFLMVGANRYIEMMMSIFKKLFPHAGQRYITCSSLEELDSHLHKLS